MGTLSRYVLHPTPRCCNYNSLACQRPNSPLRKLHISSAKFGTLRRREINPGSQLRIAIIPGVTLFNTRRHSAPGDSVTPAQFTGHQNRHESAPRLAIFSVACPIASFDPQVRFLSSCIRSQRYPRHYQLRRFSQACQYVQSPINAFAEAGTGVN